MKWPFRLWTLFGWVYTVTAAPITVSLKSIVNQQVKRIIYANSPIFREEYSIVAALQSTNGDNFATNSDSPVANYLIVIPPSLSANLAHISALAEGAASLPGQSQQQPLSISELAVIAEGAPFGARYFSITLPRPLSRDNPKLAFGVAITYVNRFQVSPSVAPQTAPLNIQAHLSPYFFSPYSTVSQKTLLTVLREFELTAIECPEPRDLRPVQAPIGGMVVNGAQQYTCGVYTDVPAFYEGYGKLWFGLRTRVAAWIKARYIERSLELDLMRGIVFVTEDYEFEHLGHRAAGEKFSKLTYVKSFQPSGVSLRGETVPMIPISVPETAYDVQFRDEVGLLHYPQQRRPSPVSRAAHVIEFQPRFPLHGGWSYWQRVTYKLPMKTVVSRLMANIEGRNQACLRLLLPLFDLFQDIPVDELVVRLTVPSDVRVFGHWPLVTGIDSLVRSRQISDRPMPLRMGQFREYRITFKNLVKEHQVYMAFHFDYSWWTPFRSIFLSIGLIFVTLTGVAYVSRLNNSARPKQKGKHDLRELMRRRQELINSILRHNESLEDNIDMIMEHQEQMMCMLSEESANSDQERRVTVAALIRLYDDQMDKVQSLNESNDPNRQVSIIEDYGRRIEALEGKLTI